VGEMEEGQQVEMVNQKFTILTITHTIINADNPTPAYNVKGILLTANHVVEHNGKLTFAKDVGIPSGNCENPRGIVFDREIKLDDATTVTMVDDFPWARRFTSLCKVTKYCKQLYWLWEKIVYGKAQ